MIRLREDMATDELAVKLLNAPLDSLIAQSNAVTLEATGGLVTYSRKVFIPLTRLCRDVCAYCTFATTPALAGAAFLSRDEVLAIVRAGERAGCREALFTLGDQPEARYANARSALQALGHETTLGYLREMADVVLAESSLLPHLNPGLMGFEDFRALRASAVSMGIMLESTAEHLCERGGPHFGSPDKRPSARLASIAAAGEAAIPFTTGLLIGLGETRAERIDALVAIRDLHRRHGHIQEVIIQNFRAKPGTRMAHHPEPSLEDHLWTIAAARLVLGPDMAIQAPPNLHDQAAIGALLRAGVNDWGGVSPVTPDHVNPEAPWPEIVALAASTAAAGRELHERLAIGPAHARDPDRWVDATLAPRVRRAVDARGLPRSDSWFAGQGNDVPAFRTGSHRTSPTIDAIIARAAAGDELGEQDIAGLFSASDADVPKIVSTADRLRAEIVGETVTFVVNRNINYTNICLYACGFCAFSKGSTRSERGPAYRLDFDEIGRRAAEAVARGATEICLQGGIHPAYDGNTYLDVLAAVRATAPTVHIHAFSPLEIFHGATTLGRPVEEFLGDLKSAGLATLPGTAAEILDDEVRALICPDKLDTDQWLDIMRHAHAVGLRSTATIMFGHVDGYAHWARHLLRIRALQRDTGGFTEFVPLPFVHMEAPIWRKGKARSGPTWREALLMHAVARIALYPLIPNIQTSWVKMGGAGAARMLAAGANDLGGTLMDESITRAAGGLHGQEFGPAGMRALAAGIGRPASERTTLYRILPEEHPAPIGVRV